ncbi:MULTISPECIES: hypothetical protein [Lysobacter]|jgi:hypothetical protein|uniref:Uncharacterized protein n=1 Tax=Lysobacter antibioticus TaxID=84531 RepID=A0A0S2FHB5_LYSAN|nr:MULTISPECIES: hypothetical protein [Lysobacter]ALN64634.1 hypothetical protein GLA29479_3783 [Lysobacter antibioticus]ALN82883.1 hypothetical protein LA76x_4780 [Lysobacter antibioticus]
MHRTRAELDGDLCQLRAALPMWRRQWRDDAVFWPRVDSLVERLLTVTPRPERGHVVSNINRMLASQGLQHAPYE